jgi:acetyl-CoA/propionyl-CoA carboxylase biotin carboxyl carrier protein
MKRALAEFRIGGVPTTIPFHRAVLAHPVFRAGGATTAFLAEYPEVVTSLSSDAEVSQTAPAEGALASTDMLVEVNGRRLTVRLFGNGPVASPTNARPARPGNPRPAPRRRGSSGAALDGPELVSPLQGTIVRVAVEPGQAVKRGEVVFVVEAMKMENELAAHRDGVVKTVHVAPGDAVRIGAALATIE